MAGEFSHDEIIDAFERIGRTPDGRAVKSYFAAMLLQAIPPNLPDGAVRESVGRLNLAREVLGHLNRITGNHAHSEQSGVDAVRTAAADAVRVGRGARRRGVIEYPE